MNDEKEFQQQVREEIQRQGNNQSFQSVTNRWVQVSIHEKYSYHFEWLGRPIIQYPQDMIAIQKLLWEIKPDLVIETGIARGGSLIFNASLLELNAQCGGPENAFVLGVDIDIRPHNKLAVMSHPMAKRIEMIQGSSIEDPIIDQVCKKAEQAKKVIVFLDSNHTHAHVLQELQIYAPLVSIGSYIVVFDTIVEDLTNQDFGNRPWGKGDNPKTAVIEFLSGVKEKKYQDKNGDPIDFEIDHMIESQLMITMAPFGFLKRV